MEAKDFERKEQKTRVNSMGRQILNEQDRIKSVIDYQLQEQENLKSAVGFQRGVIDDLRDACHDLAKMIKGLEKSLNETTSDLETMIWLSQSGHNLDDVPLRRPAPVRIFVGDPVPHVGALHRLSKAVVLLASDLGYDVSRDYEAQQGSWYKRFWIKTKEVATKDEVVSRVTKMEKVLENQLLGQGIANKSKKDAESTSMLLNALENIENAAIQLESILLVKVTGPDGKPIVSVKALSTDEIIAIEKNKRLLKQPDRILDELAALAQGHDLKVVGGQAVKQIENSD